MRYASTASCLSLIRQVPWFTRLIWAGAMTTKLLGSRETGPEMLISQGTHFRQTFHAQTEYYSTTAWELMAPMTGSSRNSMPPPPATLIPLILEERSATSRMG